MSWGWRRASDPLLGITTRLTDLAMQIGWINPLREQVGELKRENAALRDEIRSLRERADEALRIANAAGEATNRVGEVALTVKAQLSGLISSGRGERLRESLLDEETLAEDNPGVLL